MKQTNLKQMLSRDKDYRNAFVLAVAVPIVCAAAAALLLWGRESVEIFFLPCKIKQFTGYNCASCGATRSTVSLLRGDFAAAIWYNPLYIVFLGWLAYLYVRLVMSLVMRPYRKYILRLDWKWGVAVGVTVIVYTVIRNLPFYQAIFY